MYSKASEFTMANEARKEMFFQKNKNLDVIPPTENALFHHCQRAIYQTGVWGRCLETYQSYQVILAGKDQRSNNSDVPWEPVWITNGEASKEYPFPNLCTTQSDQQNKLVTMIVMFWVPPTDTQCLICFFLSLNLEGSWSPLRDPRTVLRKVNELK